MITSYIFRPSTMCSLKLSITNFSEPGPVHNGKFSKKCNYSEHVSKMGQHTVDKKRTQFFFGRNLRTLSIKCVQFFFKRLFSHFSNSPFSRSPVLSVLEGEVLERQDIQGHFWGGTGIRRCPVPQNPPPPQCLAFGRSSALSIRVSQLAFLFC